MLVEPACGAALAGAYFKSKEIFDQDSKKPIVVIVCGGNMATIELFDTWKTSLKSQWLRMITKPFLYVLVYKIRIQLFKKNWLFYTEWELQGK